EKSLHTNREDRMILVDDRRDVQWIGLAGLARHPVDALRRVEVEPGLELALVEQTRFVENEQFDLAHGLVRQHQAASAVMCFTQALNCTRIGISLAAPETLPSGPWLSLSRPREKSIHGPVSVASPRWQRSS